MRPTKEQSKANRQRILDAAARLYRERGIHAVGVDAVMKEAGLTHGGFYGHFKSKDELATEALHHATNGVLNTEPDFAGLADFAEAYLAEAHRDAPGKGCVIAALGPEIGRLRTGDRGAVNDYVRARIAQMQAFQVKRGESVDRTRAIAELAAMVGAMVMARAVDDPSLSKEILEGTRLFLVGEPPFSGTRHFPSPSRRAAQPRR